MKSTGPVNPLSLPPNVSPDMVRPFPFPDTRSTTENPFRTIIPELHRGPEAFYTLDGYHGMGPIWVFRKFKDVQGIYLDTEHFSSKNIAPFAELTGGTWNLVPAESDPPLHGVHRQLTNPLFTPKRMASIEEHIRQTARNTIAEFQRKGECDFMAEMAMKFPIRVFLELMGLPLAEADQFLAWELQLVRPKDIEDARQGALAVVNYLADVITKRRRKPGDDFISYGIRAEAAGCKLNEDELLGFCFNLFIGGLDTVSTNMGWQAFHLANNREQQNLLRDNPARIPVAIEEMLRAYAAVTTTRRCIKPVVLNGVHLQRGDMVTLSTPLANNDPEVFSDPEVVRFDRNPRHLTFGTGIHRCIGAALARRELTIATEEILRALADFRARPGAPIQTCVGSIIQLQSLPLVWNA